MKKKAKTVKHLSTPRKQPSKRAVKKPPVKAAKSSNQVNRVIKHTKLDAAKKNGFHAFKLVKIKNKYMFTPTEKNQQDYKPNGVHTYIVFKDAGGHTYALRTTHVYEKKKELQINKGILKVMKLPGIKFPSGVRRGIIRTDVEGKELDLNKVQAVNINENRGTYLTKKQTEKILNFVNGKKKKP